MWPGAANSGGCRSPQESARVRRDWRERAKRGPHERHRTSHSGGPEDERHGWCENKKPQPRTVGVSLLVVMGGLEPSTYGL